MNADIESILLNVPNGVNRDYLILDFNNKNNFIIYSAGIIKEMLNIPVVVNAKFNYGFRSAKIEIAFYYKNNLFLIKTVKNDSKIDKEIIKLDTIISEMKKVFPSKNIIGCILVDEKEKTKFLFEEVSKILKNKFILFSIRDILNRDKNYFDICLI